MGKCASIQHAYDVLGGADKYDISKQYLTWANPLELQSRARVFFVDGEPFESVLKNSIVRLQDAVKIRNRIAHSSSKSRADFKRVALVFLGKDKDGSLQPGYSVGNLLVEKALRGFGPKATKGTIFEAYLELYRGLAADLSA